MTTQEIIKEFINERSNSTYQLFLYKDKQLIKNGEYKKYVDRQLNKAKKTFWSFAFAIFVLSWYSIKFLIEYGSEPSWFNLSLGLVSWAALLAILFYHTKQYYTIKSTMELFRKMVDREDSRSDG